MTNIQSPKSQEPDTQGSEINFLSFAIVLAKHKNLILGVPLLMAVVVAGISLLMPNTFTATTRILPPQQNASMASALLNQIGGALGGLVGGAAGIKSPSDLYVGMLKSRSIADNLIAKFDLVKIYDKKLMSDARKALERRTAITAGKDGIITLEVDDRDPARAAEIANAYIDELMRLTTVLAVTEASQRRLFFERQLVKAKNNLVQAEVSARQALAGGVVKVDDQGRAMVETTARLRAQIAIKEVQIGAMSSFANDHNPDLQRAKQELEALKREAEKMEGAGSAKSVEIQSAEVKKTGIDSLGLLRDVKYYETVYEMLAKQYEVAKIDESKDSSLVQVIDKAVEPDRKSKPTRSVMVILTMLISGMFATVLAFVLEAVEAAKQNALHAGQLLQLKSYLRLRRAQRQ